jgi:hypothetical protein
MPEQTLELVLRAHRLLLQDPQHLVAPAHRRAE